MEEKAEQYEFEERAAIREFDGGCQASQAELLASEDLQQRGRKEQLAELQRARDKIGEHLRALPAGEEKDGLFKHWQELCERVMELRKDL